MSSVEAVDHVRQASVRSLKWISRASAELTCVKGFSQNSAGEPTSETTNSVALVRERTIPTERPPLVGEISANFWRIEGCRMVSAADPQRP
jgi:hypothetical protein